MSYYNGVVDDESNTGSSARPKKRNDAALLSSVSQSSMPAAEISIPAINLRPPTGEEHLASRTSPASTRSNVREQWPASPSPKALTLQPMLSRATTSFVKQVATFKEPPPGVLHLMDGKTPAEVLGGFDCRDKRRPLILDSEATQSVEEAYANFAKVHKKSYAERAKPCDFSEHLDSYRIIASRFSEHKPSAWKRAKLSLMEEMPQTQVHREFNRMIWHQTVNALDSGLYYDTYGEEVDLSLKTGSLLPSVSYTGEDFCPSSIAATAAGSDIAVLVKSRIGVEIFKGSMLVLLRKVPEFKKYRPLLLNSTADGHAGGTCREGGDGQEEQLFMSSNYFQTYAETGNLRWDLDTAVYTPRVTFFRGSDEPPREDGAWVESGYPFLQYGRVRTASCIAVAGIRQPILDSASHLTPADREIYAKKIRLILRVAAHQGHNFLVLSAIGCGELENPPGDIASIFYDVIMEPEFQDEHCCIKKIYFALGSNAPDGIVTPFTDVFDREHFSHNGVDANSESKALVPVVSNQSSAAADHSGGVLAVRHGPDQLNMVFRDRAGPEITLTVGRYDPLRMAIHTACTSLLVSEGAVHFSFHGRPVHPTDSPHSLHIGEGSVVFLELGRAMTPATMARQKTLQEMPILDLECRCPACSYIQFSSTVEIAKSPEMLCPRCGLRSFPHIWKRPIEGVLKEKEDILGLSSELKKGAAGKNKITTSGEVVEQDYEGQHVEAPVGGMLALVTQVQRERLCLGAICYFFFCLTFVLVASMQRPVKETFEVQSALRRELISEVIPGTSGRTFEDIASWGEFWSWADGVMLTKVYGENYALNLMADNASVSNSMFTIGKYNRVLSAIRFRQVRVKPSLPSCTRDAQGFLPTVFEMACYRDEPVDTIHSCDTPIRSHTLSRPCWGKWNEKYQDDAYPGDFEMASAKLVLQQPEWTITCLASCDAYFSNGYRSVDQHAAFGLDGVLYWVSAFDQYRSSEQGRLECREACDTSETSWATDLSVQKGKRNNPDYGTSADVVLLPLAKTIAEKHVAAMRRERWTSESTRGLAVEINTYNPNYDLATAIRIMVDASPGGLLEPHVEMMSCRLTFWGDAKDSFRLVLEIIFSIWLLYYFGIEAMELYKSRWSYFLDVWNYIEVANLSAYVFTMSMWFITINAHDFKNFKRRDLHRFKDLYPVAEDFNLGFTLASFNLIYGFIRFFKYFRLSMKFRLFWDTLASVLQVVLPLLVVFLGFTFVFVFSGHWLFGHRVERFSSISEAVVYLLLSIKEGIDYDELKLAAPGGAFLWYMSWYFLSKVLVLGLCIAITTVLFGEVLRQSQAQEASRQKAVERGAKIPTLTTTVMYDFAPCLLVRPSKEEIEAHENHRELKEALQEVDLENLWTRVMQGVLDEEEALDAVELKFLFGQGVAAEQSARHFINRICNLASLEHVDAHEHRTVLDEINELEMQVDSMDFYIEDSRTALAKRFPKLRTFLARIQHHQAPGVMEEGRRVRYVLKEGMHISGVYHLVEMKTDEVELTICAFDGARSKTMHLVIPDDEANGDYAGLAKRLRLGIEFGAGGEQPRLELGPSLEPIQSPTSGAIPDRSLDFIAGSVTPGAVTPKAKPAPKPIRAKGALAVASAILEAKRNGMSAINFEEMSGKDKIKTFVQAKPLKREE